MAWNIGYNLRRVRAVILRYNRDYFGWVLAAILGNPMKGLNFDPFMNFFLSLVISHNYPTKPPKHHMNISKWEQYVQIIKINENKNVKQKIVRCLHLYLILRAYVFILPSLFFWLILFIAWVSKIHNADQRNSKEKKLTCLYFFISRFIWVISLS